ncbi:ABC transporter substrate-binding protein [Pontibacterium granulatum]|uniref:MlaC/ttg2D family ABC transporter substrate-binding protein n=1 Tax=Pontibacterium granulatum TaxID=2036029 RepID=UPI00249AA787|nr:ABC transporter substrate-binding protein [Pontibacterium granulatum]MDI3323212.1 ABC transporter substrate-binding protein [Pontibacterium granulatum]
MIEQLFSRVLVIVSAFMLVVAMPATASWEEASQVVDDATGKMFSLLEDPSYREEAKFDALMSEIDSLLEPVVDFPYISKLVMGKYYRKASEAERAQFSDVFRTTLLKTYAKAIVGFDIKGYEIVPAKNKSPKPDKQIVTVEVTSGAGTKYLLVYYMRKKQGEWRLVNVVLDGVNLRLTFKNQFADLAQKSRGDVSKTVALWKEHVDPDASTAGNG